MQVLPRGHDFESPDVAIIEAVVLGGDSFEDIFVPLVLLELSNSRWEATAVLPCEGRVLPHKLLRCAWSVCGCVFLVNRACTVCPSISICTPSVYLVANGSSCATEAMSLPMSSVMYSARVVRG